MSTVVKTAVRVPEDSFPTFRNAPGDMISFRYFVEVVIDIHGKLAGLPGLSEDVDEPDSQAPTNGMNGMGDSTFLQEYAYAPRWTLNCIDTAPIRRDKNAVVCLSELVVGTKDSGRSAGKARRPASHSQPGSMNGNHLSSPNSPPTNGSGARSRPRWGSNGRQYSDPYHEHDTNGADHWPENVHGYDQGYNDWNEQNYWQDPAYHNADGYPPYWSPEHDEPEPYDSQPPLLRPPPEEGLSEKQLLQQREAALLPSAPPQVNGASSADDNAPSAPYIPDENDFENSAAFRDAVAAQTLSAGPSSSSRAGPSPADPEASDSFLHDMPSQPVPSYTASPVGVDQTLQTPPIVTGSIAPTGTDESMVSASGIAGSSDGAGQAAPEGPPPSAGPHASQDGQRSAPGQTREAQAHDLASSETAGATKDSASARPD